MRFALLAALAALAIGCAPAEADAQDPPSETVSQATDNKWIGKEAKPFALANDQGGQTDFGKILGEQAAVVIFYRGHW